MNKCVRIACLLVLLFTVSCESIGPKPSLSIHIFFDREVFQSFDDVSARVVLKNTGNKNILVNQRLYFQTDPFYPPETIEGLFLITDELDRQVTTKGKIDIGFPRAEFFICLSPGEEIEKTIGLRNPGFDPGDFRSDELYAITLVYQNSLEVEQIIDGREVHSWIGKIESKRATFRISP